MTEVVISVRVPKELKAKMAKYRHINWSEVVREAIKTRISIEERREAVKALEELRRRVKPVGKGMLDRWIREDRGR
ncbi:hypothetical protein J7L70_09210 [Candidatus Bathyarchaeota archaeon]|nr:hypothetical protein [Candidatus Bathyarchaeota archaeon]